MSRFSHALTSIILDDLKISQRDFALRSDVAPGQISRYMSETDRPELEVLEKMAKWLEEPLRVKLVIAYLHDTIPACTKGLIAMDYKSPTDPPSITSEVNHRLSCRLRTAVESLVEHAIENEATAAMLVALAKSLSK